MFKKARIKLTLQYLLIIMVISIFFSVVIYQSLTSELTRIENSQKVRIELGLPVHVDPPLDNILDNTPRRVYFDPEIITETKERIGLLLLILNVIILGGSTAAGYFLAGQTLKPIKKMIDDQNRFITDASHELRTPLTALKSEIEVNLREKNLKIVDAKNLLKSNLEEVNNLQSLTNELIKLNQYNDQKDKEVVVFIYVSIKLIIDKSIDKIKSIAKKKNIKVVNSVSDFNIEANGQLLTELFVIFLDNAIKYSPSKSQITITNKKTDGHIIINIIDQGMGIDEKDIPHLFDRFYRTDKSRSKSDTSGYGLGLSIAKQIVDKHHGFIKVNSQLNQGTTFSIELPIKQSKKLVNI